MSFWQCVWGASAGRLYGRRRSAAGNAVFSAGRPGQGIGKQLLLYGIQRLGVQELTVNAQNPNAVAFYRHFGFTVYKRTELDEAVRRIRCCICAWQMVKANEKI